MDKLAKMLREKYLSVNGSNTLDIYGAHERIYLNLAYPEFKDSFFTDSTLIVDLAKKVFDVPFVFESRGDLSEGIFFRPVKNDVYHQRHEGHHIHVEVPFKYPSITIDAGNRVDGSLFDRQRSNYYNFVNEVYDIILNSRG